jgi:ribonuclease E
MTKRMLIDATHAEETRVVVLDGTRLEDFDVETSTKRQLKGNIYLAKVVRVEPSLQAAFVEYGGNRHGFLAFSEIHPDYYQIPVADRQRLIEMQAEDARREEEEEDLELALSQGTEHRGAEHREPAPVVVAPKIEPEPAAEEPASEAWALASMPLLIAREPAVTTDQPATAAGQSFDAAPAGAEDWAKPDMPALVMQKPIGVPAMRESVAMRAQPLVIDTARVVQDESDADDHEAYDRNGDHIEDLPPPETIGGNDQESADDQRERRMPPRFLRNYKIQEVIHRRQILLIQVVKEERGTKGAALTTYLSLAGRFGVLMPNSPRGGGISRKITSATDRRRLKEVMAELDIPRGMGMIVRTAGANRPKPEIKRDCEYLLRLWDDIREHTMKSVAPALIYEEASLIKRAIRDVYSRDIDEILVDGEDGWRAAHDFMRMLMPSHAKKVQLWRDGGQPLFARNQVEAQLDGMLMPTVQLRSGGYLVINQAEALVAIDVNSGRSTRERNIEETALRTNLEAADEAARQLRLRDLAGLIVIDFIDMESKRHNAMVERRIKDALKNDRARIQVGHISHFGLLEMSRQRLRPSLAETSFIPCPHCGGTGHVRSTENAAIHVLRGIEDEGGKRRSAEIIVYVSSPVALYLLNHKRERLREIELRYAMRVIVAADDAQIAPQFRIEKVRTRSPDEMPVVVTAERSMLPAPVIEPEDEDEEEAEAVGSADDDDDADADADVDTAEETPEQRAADAAGGDPDAAGGDPDEAERRRKRRRRRRRGGRREDQPAESPEPVEQTAGAPEGIETMAEAEALPAGETDHAETTGPAVEATAEPAVEATTEPAVEATAENGEAAPGIDDDPRNRRRGRRGGRRRPRRENDGELSPFAVPGADQPEVQPVYAGPTPADPFGGRAFDIFDVMDQAERAAEARPAPRTVSAGEVVRAPEPETPGAEPEPVAAAAAVDRPEPEAAIAPLPELVIAPPPEAVIAPRPEAREAVQPEADIVDFLAPEPVGEPVLAHAGVEATESPAPVVQAPAYEMVQEAAIAESALAQPLVKPILVGADAEPPAEKKRGWWRR